MSCITVVDLLKVAPELAAVGGPGVGTLTLAGATVALDSVTIGAAIGTAAAGARVAGSDTWSTDGATSAQLASLVEMLNDQAASFAAIVTGLATAPTVALVSSRATGIAGDIAWATSDVVDIVLDPLASLVGGAAQLEFYIECACLMVNRACWGAKWECGVTLLAAHLATVGAGAAAGIVSGKTIDKISVSYAVTTFSSDDAAFASSRYGQDYLAMRETLLVMPLVGTGLPRAWPNRFWRGRRW
jgi:hypothetical protein